MPRLMDIGLAKLTSIILDMASLSEKSVATSMQAFRTGRNLVDEIFQSSEGLRELQEEAKDIATEMLARYQPVAGDLRYIEACLEISYGFSRFGRYAYDIADVLQMFGDLAACDPEPVEATARTTEQMMRMSIDAFTKRDVDLAKRIKQMDDVVDNNFREYISRSIHDPRANLKCVVSTTLILRYLERIADHAYMVGDSVIYIANGIRTRTLYRPLLGANPSSLPR